ncbi:10492_t:CDS:2 [Entrophospora sp. SA101]|nr:10492_t:CDS:2 [Entrophospora sp. SA101]
MLICTVATLGNNSSDFPNNSIYLPGLVVITVKSGLDPSKHGSNFYW